MICSAFALLVLLLPSSLLLLLSPTSSNAEERAQENVNDFDVIDANVDGLISYGEFQRWHHAALGAEPKASAILFGTHDLDRDGKLTVAEFVPLAFELSRKPDKEAEKVFQKFDTNSDGQLTAEELRSQSVSEEIVNGLLQVADSDQDGHISFREFGHVSDSFESHISQEAKNLGQAQSLIGALDSNSDGQISGDELSAYGRRYGAAKNPSDEQQTAAEAAMLELDRDGNGSISLEELKRLPEALMGAVGIRPIVAA